MPIVDGTSSSVRQSILIFSAYEPWPAPKTRVLPGTKSHPSGMGELAEMTPENSTPLKGRGVS
jgi:hypothetical protein